MVSSRHPAGMTAHRRRAYELDDGLSRAARDVKVTESGRRVRRIALEEDLRLG